MIRRETVRHSFAVALVVSASAIVGLAPTVAQSPSARPGTSSAASVTPCPSPAASEAVGASPAVATSPEVMSSPAIGPSPDVASSPTSSPAPGACPTGAAVEAEIRDFEFEPPELTVGVGTTVRWTNEGPSVHTVTADDGSFDSGGIAPGSTFEHAFDEPGVFSFFCRPHPNMTGTVLVQ